MMPQPPDDELELAELRRNHPDWTITPGPFKGWRAEHRSADGVQIRYLGANSIEELGERITAVTALAEMSDEEAGP